MALAAISYSPKDAAWNVSAPDGAPTRNWIGPVGAYGADGLFQLFGYATFLLPAALLALGWRWCLCRVPSVRGAIPAGGFTGSLISGGLLAGFNFWGALLVAVAIFFTALFMATRFSFAGTHAWAMSAKGPIGAVEKLGVLQKVAARWHDWQEEREQQRMRRRVEETRISGRKPVAPQSFGNATAAADAPKTIELDDESDVFDEEKEEDEEKEPAAPRRKEPIVFVGPEKTEKVAARKS